MQEAPVFLCGCSAESRAALLFGVKQDARATLLSTDVNNTGENERLDWWILICKPFIMDLYATKEAMRMRLGRNLFHARKKSGWSQEEVAGRLGVSRQTISKWELDETLPDIYQSKKLANLYGVSLDELIAFDIDVKEIQEVIDRTNDAVSEKVDWRKAWSKKYPILSSYQSEVEIQIYAAEWNRLLEDLEQKYSYSVLNAFLVLKDILACVWKQRKGRKFDG